jgi:Flp pilus assembly protein TadD
VRRARVLIDLRKYGHAVREARRALRSEPNDPEAHRLLARALWGQNKLRQARASAETAVGLAPQDAHAHSTLAGILYANGDKRGARAHHEQAVTLDPGLACFHTRYARFLLGVYRTSRSPRKDLQRSWLEAESALRLNPTDADAHLVCARLLCQQSRFLEAETSAREALAVEPNLARAHEVLGDIYVGWARHDEAFEPLREALRLNPTSGRLKRKVISALETQLPGLGIVWKLARTRTRMSSVLWLLYLLSMLVGGLVSGLLEARRLASIFLFALYVPIVFILLLYVVLVGVDLVLTLGVIRGWIRI